MKTTPSVTIYCKLLDFKVRIYVIHICMRTHNRETVYAESFGERAFAVANTHPLFTDVWNFGDRNAGVCFVRPRNWCNCSNQFSYMRACVANKRCVCVGGARIHNRLKCAGCRRLSLKPVQTKACHLYILRCNWIRVNVLDPELKFPWELERM